MSGMYMKAVHMYSGLVLGQAAPESDPELQRLPHWLYVELFEDAFEGFLGPSVVSF